MLNTANNAGIFLINTLFDLYLFILVIRLILCWVRADYFNPLSQFVIKLTQPIIVPLRRFIPTYSGIEFSTLIVIILLGMLKFLLISVMVFGLPNLIGICIMSLADALKLVLNVFFYAILLQAILSWVQPGYSPMARVLAQITTPIMRPFQRFIPPVGGFDISPIPALILLQLLIIILVNPLTLFGSEIAFK